MFIFNDNPRVFQNRLGELIVVTGNVLQGDTIFTYFLANYNDDEWSYVCDL